MDTLRPAAFFIGANTALDFVNSIAAPRSTQFDWLASGTDLLDWLSQAGLLHGAQRSALERPEHRQGLEKAAETIRAFREEFRDVVRVIAEHKRIPDDHQMIETLNRLMAQGRLSLCLAANGQDETGFALRLMFDIETPEDLLPRIAAECAEFIAEADPRYVRLCDGACCTLFFLDVSKNHKRRWCSMEVCGNRAKAAACRKRT